MSHGSRIAHFDISHISNFRFRFPEKIRMTGWFERAPLPRERISTWKTEWESLGESNHDEEPWQDGAREASS